MTSEQIMINHMKKVELWTSPDGLSGQDPALSMQGPRCVPLVRDIDPTCSNYIHMPQLKDPPACGN